jgi:hypothetical protein
MKITIKLIAFISILFFLQSCISNSKKDNEAIPSESNETKFNGEEELSNINNYIVEKLADSVSNNNYTYWLKNGKIIKLEVFETDGEVGDYYKTEDYYFKDNSKVFAYQTNELNIPNAIDYKALIYYNDSKIIKENYWERDVKKSKKSIEDQLNRLGSTIQNEIIIDKETNKARGLLTILDLSKRYGFDSKNGQNNNNNNNSVDNSIQSTSNTCAICGRVFHNRGYEEGSDGVWRELEEGNQGQICSPDCGRKHNQQFNDVAKKHGINLQDSETNSSSEGEYKMGNDGRVYEQNKCPLCKGTGIETGKNIATGKTEARICPVCEGRGVRSY